MVKLTADLIARQIPGHNKRRTDESVEHYLSRLTHLPFQNRSIDLIDVIPPCRNLTVIYLYDNLLTKIENINFAENLTHLYLQNNRLQKLSNLDRCLKLEKLYLGGNQIQVVEGLEKCNRLTELYIENQRLPDGEKLLFEPRTLQSLSQVLEILNVSGNNLDSLVELNCLEKLQELAANNNRLENLREFIQLLKSWPRLKRLDCSRNPMCFKSRYRERVIVASKNLEMLDGKQINENARQFLVSWKASREVQHIREKPLEDAATIDSDHTMNGAFFLPRIRSNLTRQRSMATNSISESRRNAFKADLTITKKNHLLPPMLIESSSRKFNTKEQKSPGFLSPSPLTNTGPSILNFHYPISSRNPSIQQFFK